MMVRYTVSEFLSAKGSFSSIDSRIFFKFCIHIVIGDEWYGIVNGQNPSFFYGVTALFRIGKMVSGLLFLYCS